MVSSENINLKGYTDQASTVSWLQNELDTAGNIYSYDSIATYNLDTQQVNGTKLDALKDLVV